MCFQEPAGAHTDTQNEKHHSFHEKTNKTFYSLSGCSDYLNKENEEQLNEEVIITPQLHNLLDNYTLKKHSTSGF